MNNRMQNIDTTISKAIREASERKAKKIHFYQNGKPYDAKLTVSIIPGKEFFCLEQLNKFLTEKTKLLYGVQYIFTINGELIHSLDELEHDQTYVISGTKTFIHHPYGAIKSPSRKSNHLQRYKFVREDDLRLLRPLSSKYNNVYSNVNNGSGNNLTSQNRDIRTVTIVNNKNHEIYSKVILNLKSPKSFDLLLTDLGNSVQMKSPKIMFTANGQMVKSISHLKHELADINLFYIDNEHPHEPLSFIEEFQISNIKIGESINYVNTCNLCNGFTLQNKYSYFPLSIQSNYIENNKVDYERMYSAHTNNPKRSQIKKRSELECSNLTTFTDKAKKGFEPETTFCLEQLSPQKYEQIQNYAEKLLNETSFQIQKEGLLPKEKPNPYQNLSNEKDVNQCSSQINNNNNSNNNNLKVRKSLNRGPIVSKNKADIIVQKTNHIKTNKSDKMRNQEKHCQKSLPSLSRSNERINDTLKDVKIKFHSHENLHKVNEQKNSISTMLINRTNNPIVSKKISPNSSKNGKNVKEKKDDDNNKLTKINIQKGKSKLKNCKNNENFDSKNSLQKLDDINTKAKLRNVEKYLHGTLSPPSYFLSLNKIFGYNGKKSRDLVYLTSGELAFYSGVFAILWNHNTGKQRFYNEHENDICWVDPACEYIATSHLTDKTLVIRIWSIKTLKTIKILTNQLDFVDMEFTSNNCIFILTGMKEPNISLWNWRMKINITNASKLLEQSEQVFGLTVHPLESDIVVTYGKMHLVVWHFNKNKTIECRTALQMQSKIIKTIYCAEFLNDNSLLTGDSSGNLTIWAPFEVNKVLEFAIKEVKGHESQLNCFKLTKENILISGDKEGVIKTWDLNDNEFRLLNAVKLSSLSGSVSSITLPYKLNKNMEIFIGTSNNFILKGSALQPDDYQIIFEGHFMAIRTISIDLKNNIYTASLDGKICKWTENGLIWKIDANIQGLSSTIHPSNQVLAVGSTNGIIIIVNMNSGKVLQYIQLTSACIGCMSYSPNGNFLVAGCQDGNLHVIPVTENGRSYDKVSILKGPLPILTLQWSMDTQFILTSVDDDNYQELILWDLPNTRYIRNVTSFSDNLQWYNATCCGLEDTRGTWDNEQLKDVINICMNNNQSLKCIVTGDENGYIRLFSYPCLDTKSSYFQYKQGGGSVTDVKFSFNNDFIASCNFEGSIFLWKLSQYNLPDIQN